MRLPFTRQLAVSLALAAMMLRALLPDGWMPNTGSAAITLPFVICSFDGTHHSGKQPVDQDRHHGPCAFAAAAHLSPPADTAITVGITTGATLIATRFADDLTARGPPWRPNAARAPPSLT
ncbi:MAG TPA: hypothetical protein VGU69_02965 [Rhizomicrobium sp.]|nr:hypothetical protein [Rhizomicrobium sp.]